MRRFLVFTLLFAVLLYSVPAGACTTFAVKDRTGNIAFVGKSLDWGSQAAIVFANMQGITKQSLVMPPSADCPAGPTQGLNWTSQHASITINEYGRDLPNAGMNDQGLVVETMEMEPPGDKCGAVYDPEGATQSINSLQMVQYILDSFDSVDAFVRSAPNFAIVPSTVYLHYMICDPSECAVAEIKGNKLLITTGRDFSGLSLLPEIEVVNDLRHLVLTNDYYDCSFHGRNGNHAYALEDYTGFGGDRFIPFGPEYCLAPLLHDICVPGKVCEGVGCDQACRDRGKNWYNSNSVERFVRAAAESQQLSLTDITPDDMFLALNNVFSHDGNTGGTMWQIVYDLKGRRIHWRTIADGYDPNVGFTGGTRSVGFSDVDYGKCGTNPTMMANIDAAPPCNTENLPPFCNPNHAPPYDLPTCGETTCAMSPYDESYNRNLVAFSVENTEVDQGLPDFRKMVQVSLPGISDDIADEIVFNIWGGYPRGYTQCGRSVEAEDKVNLFLSSVLGPYINPYLEQTLPDPETYSTGKTICQSSQCKMAAGDINELITIINHAIDIYNLCPICKHVTHWPACSDLAYQVESTTISGLKGTSLTDLVVQKTPDTTDNLVFTVSIPDLQNPGGAVVDYYCHYKESGRDEYYKLGKLTTNGKGMFDRLSATISGDVTKAIVSDDISNPLCFAGGKIENVTIENFDPVELGFSCSYVDSALGEISDDINKALKTLGFDTKKYHTDFSNLCPSTLTTLANDLFQNSIEPSVLSAVNNAVDSKFRNCGSLTVSPPPAPPMLTAGWGGLEGEYVTARVGHAYVLEARVGADRDSGAHQFATFAEAEPGYETTCMRQGVDGVGPGWFPPCKYVDTVRMTAREGGNSVSTIWTPETEGETILLFDVARWDEKTDEVSPAALHVYVLPSGGPTSWLNLTNEGLSTKLKEVK